MRSRRRWPYLITGLAVAFVVVACAARAVRQGSWTPVISVGWLPAVVVACWPGASRRCLPRRR
jgi:hypothetical protein